MSEATAITVKRRLPPAEREKLIVDEAISYFAEVGFSGDTRELARRIGITQPLLYRYFPSKDALIERVFADVYLKRVPSNIDVVLKDRSLSLHDRLVKFVENYGAVTFREDWIRIYTYAGLYDPAFNRRYIKSVTEPLLRIIIREIRHDLGIEDVAGRNIKPDEMNLLWVWHGGLYYWAIRKFVYRIAGVGGLKGYLDGSIAGLLESFRDYWKGAE